MTNYTPPKKPQKRDGWAVIYTRFSPRPDAATSDSCEVQAKQCREYCTRKGYTIRAYFEDPDVSGKDEYRPKLDAAISCLRKGDRFVVYKQDRLARNTYLYCKLTNMIAEKGCTLEVVEGINGDSYEIEMVRKIIAALDEYNRHQIAYRTSMSMRAKQRLGKRVGGKIRYGWMADPKRDGYIVQNPKEQEAIRTIKDLRDRGWTQKRISNWLNANHADWSRSGTWDNTYICRIITREFSNPLDTDGENMI